MSNIRIVSGTGSAKTALASYDTALTAAGIHNYNLVKLSSVIPPEADLTVSGTAPVLGDLGDCIYVVEARVTTAKDSQISAGLGWVTSTDGLGIPYETAGHCSKDESRETLNISLGTARELRRFDYDTQDCHIVSTSPTTDGYTTVVVSAVYGAAEPLV